MIELNIPGRGQLELKHLVCDVNGTLAVEVDGTTAGGSGTPPTEGNATIDLLSATNSSAVTLGGALTVTSLTGFQGYGGSEFYRGSMTIVSADGSSSIGGTFTSEPVPAVVGTRIRGNTGPGTTWSPA